MIAKFFLSASGKVWRNVLGQASILGYVERIEHSEIHGWAIHRKGKPLQLSLRVDGSLYPLAATWVERADVAGQHGEQFMHCGFQCGISGGARDALVRTLHPSQPIEVLANNVVLRNLANRPKPAVPLHWEPLGIKAKSPGLKAEIESWGYFTIRGWAAASGGMITSYKLLSNGTPIECAIFHQERRDVADALAIEALNTGFEIELPGYIWEGVPPNGACQLEIHANGEPLTLSLIELTRSKASKWIADIARISAPA